MKDGKREKKEKKLKGGGLCRRAERFCLEFRRHGGNATAAALAAGYSKKTATSQGNRLLKDEKVARRLAQLAADADRKLIMPLTERMRVLSEWARDGKIDPRVRAVAIDMLNKIDGVYRVKVDVEVRLDLAERLKAKRDALNYDEQEKTLQ